MTQTQEMHLNKYIIVDSVAIMHRALIRIRVILLMDKSRKVTISMGTASKHPCLATGMVDLIEAERGLAIENCQMVAFSQRLQLRRDKVTK